MCHLFFTLHAAVAPPFLLNQAIARGFVQPQRRLGESYCKLVLLRLRPRVVLEGHAARAQPHGRRTPLYLPGPTPQRECHQRLRVGAGTLKNGTMNVK